MTPNTNLERRLAEHYASAPPLRAPDRVLLGALATIDTTRQRRGLLAPWRFMKMPTYAKLAAATAVIAVVAFGAWQLIPGPRQGPGGPGATQTPLPSPSAAPSTGVGPTQAAYVPPPLTEAFTSDLHGLSLSYPDGWATEPATELWTDPFAPQFGDPSGDLFHDPARDGGHLFMTVGSRPLGDEPFDDFLSGFLEAEGCTRGDPIIIDGADEAVGSSCNVALASSGGRGYVIMLYTSDDDLDLRSFDAAGWFQDILATVELRPQDAVDEVT